METPSSVSSQQSIPLYTQFELVPPLKSVHLAAKAILQRNDAFLDSYLHYEHELGYASWAPRVLKTHPRLAPFKCFLLHVLDMTIIGDYGLLARMRRECFYAVEYPVQCWREEMLIHGSYDGWVEQFIHNDEVFDHVSDQDYGLVVSIVKVIVWRMVRAFNMMGFYMPNEAKEDELIDGIDGILADFTHI